MFDRALLPLATLTILVGIGCTHPQFESFRKQPAPVVVTFAAPGMGGGPLIEQEYAAALRARLATRTWVVPEGTPPPAGAATLHVQVYRREGGPRVSRHDDAVTAGVVTGAAVGVIGAIAGNRNAFFDGLWWGLWTGTHVAAHEQHARRRGWYVIPNQVRGDVELRVEGSTRPLLTLEVDSDEVLASMDPLKPSEQEDPQRVREEEAKAFARILVYKLADRFEWPTAREPMWYKPAMPVETEKK